MSSKKARKLLDWDSAVLLVSAAKASKHNGLFLKYGEISAKFPLDGHIWAVLGAGYGRNGNLFLKALVRGEAVFVLGFQYYFVIICD
jgi:hypothetical protein